MLSFKQITILPCSLDALFGALIVIDQGIRNGTIEHNEIDNNDRTNQIVLVSMIEQCGFPQKKENVLSAWFVIQHSRHSGLLEYYYDKFARAADLNILDRSKLATMEDRILMQNTRPQLYGTQLVGGSKSSDGEFNTLDQTFGFHPIYDIENVNERRKSVGLIPIEEFAREKGFEFKISAN